MNRNLIETYAAGGQKLRHAVAGPLTRRPARSPGPGDGRFKNWSSISPTATPSPSTE